MAAKDEAAALGKSVRTWYRRCGPNAHPARREGRPRRIPREAFPAVYAAVCDGSRSIDDVEAEFGPIHPRTWDRYVKELERIEALLPDPIQ